MGIGIPWPIVSLPNHEPMFLKLFIFLSLTLLPYSLNHYSKIL